MKKLLILTLSLFVIVNNCAAQTPTPTPTVQTVYDYTGLKADILDKAYFMTQEIDLYINPKAKSTSCNNSVLRSRTRALDYVTKLEVAVADMPDYHYQGGSETLYCTTETSSSAVNKTRSTFTSLFNSVRSLRSLEQSCKAKYGLSYSPNVAALSAVISGLKRIPRKVISCY